MKSGFDGRDPRAMGAVRYRNRRVYGIPVLKELGGRGIAGIGLSEMANRGDKSGAPDFVAELHIGCLRSRDHTRGSRPVSAGEPAPDILDARRQQKAADQDKERGSTDYRIVDPPVMPQHNS